MHASKQYSIRYATDQKTDSHLFILISLQITFLLGSKGVVNLTRFDLLDEVPLARNRGKVQEEDQGYLRTHI